MSSKQRIKNPVVGSNGKFYKLGRTLAARRDLRPTDKLIMAVLADRIGGNGTCWPGLRSLARDTGLTRPTILQSISRLERTGMLAVQRRGSGRKNSYNLLVESGKETIPVAKTKSGKETLPSGKEPLPEAVKKLDQNQTDPLTRPIKRALKKKIHPGINGQLFDRFFSLYPKKRNKGDARKAWSKLNPKPELVQRILSAVEQQRQSADWLKEGGKYIPYPAKWLRGEQWEDEIGVIGEFATHDATDEEIVVLEQAGIL